MFIFKKKKLLFLNGKKNVGIYCTYIVKYQDYIDIWEIQFRMTLKTM